MKNLTADENESERSKKQELKKTLKVTFDENTKKMRDEFQYANKIVNHGITII